MNYVSDTIFSKLAMLSGIILYNAAMFLKQGIQMLTPEQVKSLIEGVAACEHVEVEGDGHHFSPSSSLPSLKAKPASPATA